MPTPTNRAQENDDSLSRRKPPALHNNERYTPPCGMRDGLALAARANAEWPHHLVILMLFDDAAAPHELARVLNCARTRVNLARIC